MSSAYVHGHSSGTVRSHSLRTVETSAAFVLPHLKPGLSILDVGCGPGSITAGFAPLVRPGKVVGIDTASTVVTAAQRAYCHDGSGSGNDNLSFQVADLFHLPFEDGAFDVIYAHQVFCHLPIALVPSALEELYRVCRPGGLVALRDGKPDRGGHQVYPYDPLLQKSFEVTMHRIRSGGVVDQQPLAILPMALAENLRSGSGSGSGLGWKKAERTMGWDVYDNEASREAWGEQWALRTEEESFTNYALDNGLSTEEELEKISAAWRWKENKEAWAGMVTVEHMFWR